MERREFNQNRIIRLIKEGFRDKPKLSGLRRRNLDKLVSNSIELTREKQKNNQLDRTVNRLVNERPKVGIIGFLNSLAKWQIAMLSIFALVFITSGIAFANSSIPENLKLALSTEAGKIEISSNIAGANVYLKNKNDKDFKLVGVTNYTGNNVEPGDYDFYLQKDGYVQTDIVEFSLNANGTYSKNVTLEQIVDPSKVKYLDYTNTDFGIYLKYPETTTPDFEKYSDSSFKLTIKSGDAIFVLESQDAQPTLLADYTKTSFKVGSSTIQARKYTYTDSTETFSKEAYKYGISSDGIFKVNGISYFIYSESLTENNALFDNLISTLSITKKTDLTTYKTYKFSNAKLGVSFDYYDDFIYSTEVDNQNEVRVRLENKNNKDEFIMIDWQNSQFGTYSPSNFTDTSKVTQTTLNSNTIYQLNDNVFEISYLLPNNILIYAYKVQLNSQIDRLIKQIQLLKQTFQTSNTNLGISYPYQTNTNDTTSAPISSSSTSSFNPKD